MEIIGDFAQIDYSNGLNIFVDVLWSLVSSITLSLADETITPIVEDQLVAKVSMSSEIKLVLTLTNKHEDVLHLKDLNDMKKFSHILVTGLFRGLTTNVRTNILIEEFVNSSLSRHKESRFLIEYLESIKLRLLTGESNDLEKQFEDKVSTGIVQKLKDIYVSNIEQLKSIACLLVITMKYPCDMTISVDIVDEQSDNQGKFPEYVLT